MGELPMSQRPTVMNVSDGTGSMPSIFKKPKATIKNIHESNIDENDMKISFLTVDTQEQKEEEGLVDVPIAEEILHGENKGDEEQGKNIISTKEEEQNLLALPIPNSNEEKEDKNQNNKQPELNCRDILRKIKEVQTLTEELQTLADELQTQTQEQKEEKNDPRRDFQYSEKNDPRRDFQYSAVQDANYE